MKKSQLKKELTLRQLVADDVEEFNELLRYAFQVTEKDLLTFGWNNAAIKQSKYPVLKNAYVLGWFNKDKLVSQIALYPMQINIYNSIFEMGGITGVATYPEYSGIGLMADLIQPCVCFANSSCRAIKSLLSQSTLCMIPSTFGTFGVWWSFMLKVILSLTISQPRER